MKTKLTTSRHGFQQLYYVAIVFSLFGIAILSVGCSSPTPSTSDKGGAQPSPSPKIGVDSRKLGDTPIVITGGSFQLDLNMSIFRGSNGEYSVSEDTLNEGWIYDNQVTTTAPKHLENLADSDIVIYYKLTSGDYIQLLTVVSRSNSKTVTVRFNESILPRRHPGSNQFFSTGTAYKISRIVVTPKGGSPTTYNEGTDFPNNNKLGMELFGPK